MEIQSQKHLELSSLTSILSMTYPTGLHTFLAPHPGYHILFSQRVFWEARRAPAHCWHGATALQFTLCYWEGVNCDSLGSSWHRVWHQSACETGRLTLKPALLLVKNWGGYNWKERKLFRMEWHKKKKKKKYIGSKLVLVQRWKGFALTSDFSVVTL